VHLAFWKRKRSSESKARARQMIFKKFTTFLLHYFPESNFAHVNCKMWLFHFMPGSGANPTTFELTATTPAL
jgi:hypothetical protein